MPDAPQAPLPDARAAGDLDTTVFDRAEFIDELMAQPIKDRPQITVVGDDAVFGINPSPTKPPA